MPKRLLDKISLPLRILISVGGGALLAIVCCLIFAAVAKCSDDPAARLTLYGEICFLVSMLFCGFSGAKICEERKIVCGMMSGGGMLLLALLPSLFIGTGGVLKALVLALLGMFFSALGAVVGSRQRKRKRRR